MRLRRKGRSMARRLLLKFGLLTAAAIAPPPTPAPAGAQTADSAAHQGIAVEKAYLDSQLQKDRPRLGRMLADAFLHPQPDGSSIHQAHRRAESGFRGMPSA